MSFSRTQYDTDAYKYALEESTQPGKAQLQKFAFTRADHCFAETPEQRVQTRRVFKNYEQNDLINIESDLQGVTRKWSKDPKQQYPYKKSAYQAPAAPAVCKIETESLSTRLVAPQFKRGQGVNRFYDQCLNPQQLNRIRSNMYIGVNTRLYNRDNYVPQIPKPLGPTGLPQPKPVKPAMNCECTLANAAEQKPMKLNNVFCNQAQQ